MGLLFMLCSEDQILHFLHLLYLPQPMCNGWGEVFFNGG